MPDPIAASTIAQQACRFLEKGPVSSFDEDSELAGALQEQYPNAIAMCLEAQDWGFARRLVTLPQLATLPDGEIADSELPHAYALPADCVALRRVEHTDAKFRRDEGLLRADVEGGLTIRYTRAIDNEALLPATFRNFVALQLAVLLSPEYVTTRTKRADLDAMLERAELRALRAHQADASAARHDGMPDQPDWATEAVS